MTSCVQHTTIRRLRSRLVATAGACAVVVASVASSGCASLSSGGVAFGPRPANHAQVLDPRLGLDVSAPANAMEREAVLAANAPRDDGSKKKEVTPALFWTGIILGSVGAVGMIGGGVTGAVTERQIVNGDADGWTRDERQQKIQQGETANAITITGAVLTLVGYGMATVVAGIDFSRCGPVTTKKRRRECGVEAP